MIKFLPLLFTLISFTAVTITPPPASAALTASAVGELRQTGSSTLNSGWFDSGVASPGTDYTLQDGSQFNGTDLASVAGTTNPCVVTSATHNFVAADVGNTITVSAGTNWTVQRLVIESVLANAATTDKACGSAIDLTTNKGTWREGGAFPLGNSTAGISDDAFFEMAVPKNKVFVKYSATAYVPTAVSIAAACTLAGGECTIEGYNATRGDRPTTTATRPTINAAANAWAATGNAWVMRNMNFTPTAAAGINMSSSGSKFIENRCINKSATAARACISINASIVLVEDNEIVSYHGPGIVETAGSYTAKRNYFHDSDTGVNTSALSKYFSDNLFENFGTGAVLEVTAHAITAAFDFYNNTFIGTPAHTNGGYAITLLTTAGGFRSECNIFDGFSGTAVIHADAINNAVDDYNAYYNNGTDVSNVTKGSHDVATDPGMPASWVIYSGSTGTTSGSVLTQSGATLPTFTYEGQPAADYLHIVSGSGGILLGSYGITANTGTTITTDVAIGTNATTDTVWYVTRGHDFSPGVNMKGLCGPTLITGSATSQYKDVGGVQRKEKTNTDVGVANVLSTASYTFDDSAKTGTYVAVATTNVRNGTTYGAASALTGTASIPTAANVRSGTATDATTGTLAVPTVGNVLSGVSTDNTTGTYVTVATGSVKTGVTYGASSALTGTYTGSDRWSDVGIANVRSGSVYKADSTSNNRTGTASIPVAGDVRSGTATDATTGSLAVPAVGNVLSGISVDNTTGTYVTVSTGNVKTGITYGAASALTGTYTGSDRWSDVGIANVRSGSVYKADSTSNNRTGTASIPGASDVRSGTATDATTGTLAVPSAANVLNGFSVDAGTGTYVTVATGNVRSGTAFGASSALTGTLVVPALSNVLNGISVDAGTGTYVVVSTANVKTGITFGAASVSTGTYDGSDRWTDPGVNSCLDTVSWKANSTSNNRTGTYHAITAGSVKHDVAFGVSSESTGTYDGSDLWSVILESTVQSGIAYQSNSLTNNKTGTLTSLTVVSGEKKSLLGGRTLTGKVKNAAP